MVSKTAKRTEPYRALKDHLEAVDRFVIAIHKHLDSVMFPTSNMTVAIVNMLAEKFTSTIKSKGFTVSHYSFTFDWDTTNSNEFAIPEALRTGDYDITKTSNIFW